MKRILFLTAIVATLALGQKPKPTPTPSFLSADTAPKNFTYGALTFKVEPTWQIRIHSNVADGVVMDFSAPDGKTLTVKKDGTVFGDLPMTDAAKAFWSELGKAFPAMCAEQKQAKR